RPQPPAVRPQPQPRPQPPVVRPQPQPRPQPPVVRPQPQPRPQPPVVRPQPQPRPQPPVVRPQPRPRPPVVHPRPRPLPRPAPRPPVFHPVPRPPLPIPGPRHERWHPAPWHPIRWHHSPWHRWPTRPVIIIPAPAPTPTSRTYHSPDRSRKVIVSGDDKIAFLHDSAYPIEFDPVYLGEGVHDVTFQVDGFNRLTGVMTVLDDGAYDMFDKDGRPAAKVVYSPDRTRKAMVSGPERDAYLFDAADPAAFNPVYLGSQITGVQFQKDEQGA
ncbi:MAG: hypothetical protein WC943_14725, partial [Elusimicrobiota bacterium]